MSGLSNLYSFRDGSKVNDQNLHPNLVMKTKFLRSQLKIKNSKDESNQIIILLIWDFFFFAPALADGFPLESEWQ